MRELAFVIIGMCIGNWGPPLIVWFLTRHERAERKVRRATLDEMLRDIRNDSSRATGAPPEQEGQDMQIQRHDGLASDQRPTEA